MSNTILKEPPHRNTDLTAVMDRCQVLLRGLDDTGFDVFSPAFLMGTHPKASFLSPSLPVHILPPRRLNCSLSTTVYSR